MTEKSKLTKSGINALTSPFRWILITAIVYFLSSGTIEILRSWIYIGVYIAGSLVSSTILYKKIPGLLNQRGKIQQGTKKWDTFLILTYFAFAIIVTPLTAGLDYRFNSFSVPFVW